MRDMRGRVWWTLLVVSAWWTLYGVATTSQWLTMEGADGKVMPLRDAPERCPYFAIVIVHGQGRRPANDM